MTQLIEPQQPERKQDARLAAAQLAVERVAQDCLEQTKYRAALRRNQGLTLAEARGAVWFRGLLAQIRREAKEKELSYLPSDELMFLVGSLLADDARALEWLANGQELTDAPRNLGASLSLLEFAQDREAYDQKLKLPSVPNRRESRFERRLRMLLDAGLTPDGSGELPFRLRQAARMILSQKDGKVHVHWAQLLHDLYRWNWENRPAQRDWARSFYGDPRMADAPAGSISDSETLAETTE